MLDIMLRTAYLLAIGLSLYISGWLIIKADKNKTTGALTVCQLPVIIWCIPQLFSALPMSRGMKYLAYIISHLGTSFIGLTWLELVFLYSKRKLNHWAKSLLSGISAVNYSILLTNEYHHLFYITLGVEQMVYGPVFYIYMVYTYLCVLAGMAAVLMTFRKNRVALPHMAVILLSAATLLGFNLLYMTGLVRSGFDLTPPAFALSSILVLPAAFCYDFLDVNTMAYEQTFDMISEGVVVYNQRGEITHCNEVMKTWFGLRTGDEAKKMWNMLKDRGIRVDEEPGTGLRHPGISDTQDPVAGSTVLTLDGGHEKRKLEIKHYNRCDKKRKIVAGTVMFSDVGRYYQLLEQGRELVVSNQKLAIEQERNRTVQEVYDTAGHTLTMINSLLKLIRIDYESGGTDAGMGGYLSQAQELAGSGICQLRCSTNNLRQGESYGLVTQGVYQLAVSIKEIEVEVEIQGEGKQEYSYPSPIVYENLREAITNRLKYIEATHMDVILRFSSSSNSYISDNGRGCSSIEEGNGLSGIRRKMERAGDKVRTISGIREGSQIYINLPPRDRESA